MSRLPKFPDQALVPGVKRSLGFITADGNGWPIGTYLRFGPYSEETGKIDDVIAPVYGVLSGNEMLVTLEEAQVDLLADIYPWANGASRIPIHIRVGEGAAEEALATGFLMWDLEGGSTSTATVMVGPAGPTAISADADNVATLGTDGLIYVAPGAGTVSSVNGLTGAVVLAIPDTEAIQDVVGSMVAAAGGSYNDAAGTITLPGGGSDPWTYLVATSDTGENSGVETNISGLSVSNLADGLYEFRAMVIGTSVATGIGAQVGMVAPAGCTVTLWSFQPNGAPPWQPLLAASTATVNASVSIPKPSRALSSSESFFAGELRGIFRAASMSGALAVTIKSESASQVYAKADSFLAYRRIAS